MKKLTSLVLAALVITASAAQVADGLIKNLLNFSVKELIAGPVFDGVWKSAKSYGMAPSGSGLYYSARESSYDNLGISYNDGGWEAYIQARTIAVARIKSHFSDGENLKDMYLAVKPRFKEEYSKLSDKEKAKLRKTLSDAKTCFEMLLKKENQVAYKEWLDGFPISENRRANNWLTENLSADEIAKRIKAGELKDMPEGWEIEEQAFKAYPDEDIAQFAGRRFKDGGEALLRKYIEVIDLAIADMN